MIKFKIADDEHESIAQKQKQYCLDMAEKILVEDDLNIIERRFIAAILKKAGTSTTFIPEKQPRKPGHQSEVCHGTLALLYVLKQKAGLAKDKAIKALADEFQISEEALRKSLKKHQKEIAEIKDMLEHSALREHRTK